MPITEDESPRLSNLSNNKSLTDHTKKSLGATSLDSIHINLGKQEKDSQRDSTGNYGFGSLPSVHRESGAVKVNSSQSRLMVQASSEPESNQMTALPPINKSKFGQTTQIPTNANNNNNNNNNTSKSIATNKLLQSFKKV